MGSHENKNIATNAICASSHDTHSGRNDCCKSWNHFIGPVEVAQRVATNSNERSNHRYGLVSGTNELLAHITKKLQIDNQVTIDITRRVVVTAGSNMGFQSAVLAIADPDDEIIIMSPYYFNHEMAIAIAGCKAVIVPTDSSYQLDIEAITQAITSKTKAIVTVSPNNPTGAVYPQKDLLTINHLCKAKGIYHISDEAYEYFVYEEARHFSPASLVGSEAHTISLYSLSKAYGMAGWRVGYVVIPEHLEVAIKKIQDTNLICPPMISQQAACAAIALGKPWCNKQIKGFGGVRQLVLTELGKLDDKIIVPPPFGAFYVLLKLKEKKDDMQILRQLIERYKIAVMPGSTFGVTDGTYLRIAYGALAQETVAEGMGRLVKGLNELL